MTTLTSLFDSPNPVALVTGSGAPRVGNIVARALASRGYRLIIHANRSVQPAEETAAELGRQARAGDLLDDHGSQQVVGVRVAPSLAGFERFNNGVIRVVKML